MPGFRRGRSVCRKPAYDDLIQGAVALPTLFARQGGGEPRYAPVTLADRAVGLQSAIALLAAVLHAQRTGQGQAVEMPMFEALAQFVMGDHLGGQSFEPAEGPMGYERLLAPHRKPYRTADGHLSLLIYNDKHWHAFFDVIDRPELKRSPLFSTHTARAAHIGEVYAFVAEVMVTRPSAEWHRLLEAADVPVGRLNTVESLLEDPHLKAVGFFPEMDHPSEGQIRTTAALGRYSATPSGIHRHAPRLGEHSVELLREAGYAEHEVEALLSKGVSVQADMHTETNP